MKAKYICEDYPMYFLHGERSDGRVTVASVEGDIAVVTKEEGKRLVRERNRLVQRLCDTAIAWADITPGVFAQFWFK